MRIHKFISTILHPIVVPTVGVMLYFLVIPSNIISYYKFTILSLVFVITYMIPLLVLFLLKKLELIKTYNLATIKERRLPILLMVILFFLLGNTLDAITNFRDLGILFYATSLGLILTYILLFLKVKSSIHLLSLGISTGYFMVLSHLYNSSFMIIILIIILLSGILASSRLHLKAHTSKEIYIGFFIGVFTPFFVYILL